MDISKLKGMKGVFDSANKTAESLQSFRNPFAERSTTDSLLKNFRPPLLSDTLAEVDRRSRQEVREDREIELSKINLDDIEAAQKFMEEEIEVSYMEEDEVERAKNNIIDCLDKLHKYKTDFDELNSNHSRHIALREHELEVEAAADWKEKWRIFWFRALGSVLLIVTLFAIGTIHHYVDWLYLPFESVMKLKATSSNTAPQVLLKQPTTSGNTEPSAPEKIDNNE